MSITCSEIQELHLNNISFVWKYVYVYCMCIDPKTFNKSPLPRDYKFGKCCLSQGFARMADRIHNFKIRSDDVWIVGYPKSGTTWMHNIIWQLKNELDFSAPAIIHSHHLFEDASLLQSNIDIPIDEMYKYVDQFDELPSPRILKSHLPAFLLPKELWTVRPKIIYTARNPKDIAISAYHFFTTLTGIHLTIETTFDLFLSEKFLFGPLHDHVLSFWQLRHLDHVLFCMYEELLADPFNGVKRVSEFLQCSYSVQQLLQLSEHLSFDSMKENMSIVASNGTKKDNSEHRYFG